MIDASLLVTLALIFAATLVGSYLRARRRDPCLASFEGYHVTLQLADGKSVWGELKVEPTGLEIFYRQAVRDDHHLESSYLLYAEEFPQIRAIFRFVDELSPENRERRAQDLRRSFRPNLWERAKREVRKFLNTARDSMGEVIGLLLGRVRKPAGRYITDTGENYLKKLGTTVIGYAGNNYDPLLERLIGSKVVVEVLEGNELHEHVGIFKHYSGDFLEILDVQYPFPQVVTVGANGCEETEILQVERLPQALRVHNVTGHPLLLRRLVADDGQEVLVSAVVDAGERATVPLPDGFQSGRLEVRRIRELDMLMPRSRCVIRHRAEEVETLFDPRALLDIVFDVGILLWPDERARRQEERLRARLEAHPLDGPAAVELASLLIRRGQYSEAEALLRPVLTIRRSLPDNGRRAEMLLREIRRRRDGLSADLAAPGPANPTPSRSAVPVGRSPDDLPGPRENG